MLVGLTLVLANRHYFGETDHVLGQWRLLLQCVEVSCHFGLQSKVGEITFVVNILVPCGVQFIWEHAWNYRVGLRGRQQVKRGPHHRSARWHFHVLLHLSLFKTFETLENHFLLVIFEEIIRLIFSFLYLTF